ncbi:GNAT family N-acetyltransferase [Schleiferiaceae bacterium]|nr:GNAT family N-acetyltransferase [Schleiferiaceae bacterium]
MKAQFNDVSVRWAEEKDLKGVMALIQELAIFEKAPLEVTLSLTQFTEDFHAGHFVCVLAEEEKHGVLGIALCHRRYSTWKGLTAHLEDLVVREAFRGAGLGRRLLEASMQWAESIGAQRLHWEVLDWNQPAIDFYEGLGAQVLRDWYPCRLTAEDLATFSYRYPRFIPLKG